MTHEQTVQAGTTRERNRPHKRTPHKPRVRRVHIARPPTSARDATPARWMTTRRLAAMTDLRADGREPSSTLPHTANWYAIRSGRTSPADSCRPTSRVHGGRGGGGEGGAATADCHKLDGRTHSFLQAGMDGVFQCDCSHTSERRAGHRQRQRRGQGRDIGDGRKGTKGRQLVNRPPTSTLRRGSKRMVEVAALTVALPAFMPTRTKLPSPSEVARTFPSTDTWRSKKARKGKWHDAVRELQPGN